VLRPGTILGEGPTTRSPPVHGPVVLGLTDTDVPFVFVHDRDVAEVIARGVAERVTGVFNLAGDGVLTLRDIAAIEGKPFVPLPPGCSRRAGGAAPGRLPPYGPEQVDFLRYRPVLANDGAARVPGLPRAGVTAIGSFATTDDEAFRGWSTSPTTGCCGRPGDAARA
jgi:UDP-glucose 4-epimerase